MLVVIGSASVRDLLGGFEVAAAGAEPASRRRPQQGHLPLVVERVSRQVRVLLTGLVVHCPRRRRGAPVTARDVRIVLSLVGGSRRWHDFVQVERRVLGRGLLTHELEGVLDLRLHG